MRILVIGANGVIGKKIVKQLKELNHEPVAMIRKEGQANYFKNLGVLTVKADLEKDFEHAFSNIDMVVFTAGSGSNTGADKTIIIDQEGAIESMKLAKKYKVKHYMIISAMRADDPKNATSIKHYLYAKHRADEYLKASGLTYTIIRPGLLTNNPGTGRVNLQEKLQVRGEIPREDVASVVTHLIMNPRAKNKTFEVLEGNIPISKLLA
ncbi:MAG TPA: SDR family oxidoreductase [Pseudogracilibacillus sp.]|nr:SDR family oxidoreductase [Pseudogracilibacillus sp.]